MKIAIVGLIGSENLGERFIAKSLTWLIRDCLKKKGESVQKPNSNPIQPQDVELISKKNHNIMWSENRKAEFSDGLGGIDYVFVDLEGKKNTITPTRGFIKNRLSNYEFYSRLGLPGEIFYLVLKRIVHKTKNRWVRESLNKIRHSIWKHSRNLKKRSVLYFNNTLMDVDFIVVDGAGLLEYSKNEYHEYINTLCKYADEKQIPVVFNAIGRSGEFDESDFRCKVLMESFQCGCVKYISARDSVEDVQKCVSDRFSVKLRADAAFWFDRAYELEKIKESSVIGIGLIRGNSMQAYGVDFKEEDWIDLFAGIAKELDKRDEKYQFFTNGYPADFDLGKKVIEKLGKSDNYLAERPVSDNVLAQTISSFSGLITCRMHSSIAAFTLGIPSVVLSWNPKINKYMEIIGYPERAIDRRDFDPEKIVDRFVQARNEGISFGAIEKMRRMASASVDDYLPLLHDEYKRSSL